MTFSKELWVYLVSIASEWEKPLLHVVGANVDGKHIGPGHGGGEHAALGIHPSPEVGLGPSEGQVLFTPVVVVLSSERVKVNG